MDTANTWKRSRDHILGTLATLVVVVWMPNLAAQAEPDGPIPYPEYTTEPCCQICPEAADLNTYQDGYFDGFRRLVQGKDGWLFRTEDDLPSQFGLQAASYSALERLNETLREQGVHLVMVPIPPRALLQWAQLPEGVFTETDREIAQVGYRALLGQLRKLDIVVPELDHLLWAKLEQPFFFRRDHHWTPEGAKQTAALVAEAIARHKGYTALERAKLTTERTGVLRKSGTYARAVEKLCGFGYPDQFVDAYATVKEGQSSDLFGDATAPEIVLIGTSNSDPAYNFAGFLSQALEVDVFNAAVTGGGLDSAMQQFVNSAEFRSNPPKFLIWEMPVYSNFDDEDMYRRLLPHIAGGCGEAEPVLTAKKPLSANGPTEVLFNGDGGVLPINSGEHIVEVKLSDKSVRKLSFSVWYMNGKNDTFTLEHSQYIEPTGHFVSALRDDESYSDAVFMGLDIEVPDLANQELEAEVTLCKRQT